MSLFTRDSIVQHNLRTHAPYAHPPPLLFALQVSLFTRDSTVQRNLRTLVQALSRLVEE